jgi:tetratricopeptide (TPR) repeat protein
MHLLSDPQGLLIIGIATAALCVLANVPEMLLLDALSLQEQGKHQSALWLLQRAAALGAVVFGNEHRTLARIYLAQARSYKELGDSLKEFASASRARSAAPFGESSAKTEEQLRNKPHNLLAAYHFESAHFMGLVALTIVPAIIAVTRSMGTVEPNLAGALGRFEPSTVNSQSSPVVFINSSLGPLPLSPRQLLFDFDESPREKLEALYLSHNYHDAIIGLKKYLANNPSDIKASLCLGKAYLATNRPEDALASFASARLGTHEWFEVQKAESLDPTFELIMPFSSLTGFFLGHANQPTATSLEEELALDAEARDYLAKTVLAMSQSRTTRVSVPDKFSHDDRYILLKACVQMAQRCHNRPAKYQVQDALYEMAEDLAIRFPGEVVTDCDKSPDSSWDAAASKVLNSKTEAELRWNERSLLLAGAKMKDTDIRKAAGLHLLASDGFVSDIDRPDAMKKVIEHLRAATYSNKKLYEANCYFDVAHAQYDRTEYFDAERNFAKAQELYAQYAPTDSVDAADALYGRAMSYYLQGRLPEAGVKFKQAAAAYAHKFDVGNEEWCKANFATLATETYVDWVDEKFMLDYGSKVDDPDAWTQVGLYFCKLGAWDKAEPWLQRAAQVYLTPDGMPMLSGSTNGTIFDVEKDQSYTTDQVLKRMFTRSNRSNHCVGSRFCDAECIQHANYQGPVYSSNLRPHLRRLCLVLYEQALIRGGRYDLFDAVEAKAHLSTSDYFWGPDLKNPDMNGENPRLASTRAAIESAWFPPAEVQTPVVVQFHIAGDGTPALDKMSNCSNAMEESIAQALQLAPLPHGQTDSILPSGWQSAPELNGGKEITAVFQPHWQPEPARTYLGTFSLSRYF